MTFTATLLAFLDVCLKTTLVLGLTGLGVRACRRGSAAARHLVLTLGLLAVLALPVLAVLAPRWELPLLPSHPWLAAASVMPEPSLDVVAAHARATRPSAPGLNTPVPPSPLRAQGTALRFPRLDGMNVLSLVWLLGALGVALPVLVGALRIFWLARKTEPLSSPSWSALAQEIADDLALTRPVRLLRGGPKVMPMAWGLLRPVVLLPEDAEQWPEAQRRAVLTHELAHVKRHDCLTQTLAHAACALYWFHPLVWVAARRLRAEREHACDDLVLRCGASGPDYADHLLQLARGFSAARQPSWAGVSMARPSQLEGRLLAILDPTLDRRGPSRLGAVATAGIAGLLVVPLAGLQPWARPVLAARPLDATAAEAQDEVGPTPTTALRPETSAARETKEPAEPRPAPQGPTAEEAGSQERVVTALASALRDADGEVRQEAVAALGQLRAESAAGALAEALKDSDDEVRAKAAFALGELRSTAAASALGEALTKDASAEVRQQAAFALGQIRAQASVTALVAALADKETEVRQQAVFALGQIRAVSGVEGLATALKDTDAEVRQQAAFALGQIRDGRAVAPLKTALQDGDAEVRKQAVFALGQIRAADAAEAITQALKDREEEVRQQAAFALGQLRSREAVPALIKALGDESAEVRQQAAFALGELRDPRATDALAKALKDPEAEVRKQAAFALGQLEP